MIVNRSHAEEAFALLNDGSLAPTLDGLLEQQVKELYREACKTAHPDAVGGSIEKFAAVDRAKHVLLHWLAKQADKPAVALMGAACDNCTGKGYVEKTSQRGFKLTTLRAQCRKCNGTGEEGVEHDRGDWG